jgi:hypothetical protein
MKINKRIDEKYKKELEIYNSTTTPIEMIEALEAIFYHDEFSQDDFFDFLDYLVNAFKNGKKIESLVDKDFGLERQVLDIEMTEFMENWDMKTQDKYFNYFKSKENMMSLTDWPEPIFDYYKDHFNWDMILFNTLVFELDNHDHYALKLIEKYQKSIFEENDSGYHVAADSFLFFQSYMYGVQFDIDFVCDSIVNGTSRFAKYILLNDLVKDYINRDKGLDGARMFTHEVYNERFNGNIIVTIEPLLARLAKEPAIIEFFEEESDESDGLENFNF